MFFNLNKIKKDMIPMIRPTSKVALKMSCLQSCNGDIDKAERLYSFLIKDMEDLPTFDAIQPSTFDQIKEGARETVGWISQNQDQIMNWVGFFKGLMGKGNGVESQVPPVSNPIPPINH